MASPTKTRTNLIPAGTSIAAGATYTSAGWVNLGSYFEAGGHLGISIPGSAPSAGPTITFSYSPDNGATVYSYPITGLVTAAAYRLPVEDADMYFQLSVKNNDGTTNAIVAGADLTHIDTVA